MSDSTRCCTALERNQSCVRQNSYCTRNPLSQTFEYVDKTSYMIFFLHFDLILEDNNKAYFQKIVSVYELYINFIHSLLNIKGRSFIREEFCPAPELNMSLNNEKDTIVHCYFIKISQRTGLSSAPISILVFTLAKLTSDVANLPYHYPSLTV